jgi:hypothetical protein
MTPEGKVKKEVKKLLERFSVYYYMPVPGGYGKAGKGDFICCVAGYFLAIETKKDKGELTELQDEDRKDIERSKGIKVKIGPQDLGKLELLIHNLLES